MTIKRIICLSFLFCLVAAACTSGGGIPKGIPGGAAQTPESGEAALEWSRDGGIAGFCDRLVISAQGEAVVTNCKKEPPVEVSRSQLKPDQLSLLEESLKKLKAFEYEQSDPAVADAMKVKIKFHGTGTSQVTEADQLALLELASQIVASTK